MSLGLSLMVFILVAGKNIFVNKSPNSTVKNKKQNTTITPAYHYVIYTWIMVTVKPANYIEHRLTTQTGY